jgi:hypothetical protein
MHTRQLKMKKQKKKSCGRESTSELKEGALTSVNTAGQAVDVFHSRRGDVTDKEREGEAER